MIIGIYGGSFDPIHTGHSILANFISQCNVVDEVWLVVSRQNPMKSHSVFASDKDRLNMAEIVAQKCYNVKVSDIEMQLPSPSFTIETLKRLTELYPYHSFKVIIGSDSLAGFSKWRESEKILKEFGLIVYPRPGYPMSEKEGENMIFLNGAPEMSISSSLIREYITSKWDINYFVPTEVADYIKTHNLYHD